MSCPTARLRAATVPAWVSSKAVPALLALLLLVAAGLKTHQLTTGMDADSGPFTSRWSLLAVIELELCLGLWLLVGVYPRQSRVAALLCYTAFAAVSLQQALVGKASCCCFGGLPVRPWYTLLFDLAAVAALWHWRHDRYICAGGELRPGFSRPLLSIHESAEPASAETTFVGHDLPSQRGVTQWLLLFILAVPRSP